MSVVRVPSMRALVSSSLINSHASTVKAGLSDRVGLDTVTAIVHGGFREKSGRWQGVDRSGLSWVALSALFRVA